MLKRVIQFSLIINTVMVIILFISVSVSAATLSKQEIIDGMHAQIVQLIKNTDRNGDGKVSLDEYLSYTRDQYAKFDENHDGRLTFEQYKKAVIAAFEAQAQVNPAMKSMLTTLIPMIDANRNILTKMIDKNGDGFFSLDELQAEQKSSFFKLDTNQDGFIDLNDLDPLKKEFGLKK